VTTGQQSGQPLLEITFRGPAIRDGRILLDDLLQFLGQIQSAVARIINVTETGRGLRVGRPPESVRILSALEVVAMSRGSFRLGLDLRRDEAFLPLFDAGEEAVHRLTGGLSAITELSETDVGPLPEGYDQDVLMALREAGRIFDRGIEEVDLLPRRDGARSRALFLPKTREQIIQRLRRLEERWATVEGRLLMADVKEDALRCRLHPSLGEPIMCSFSEDAVPTVLRNMRRFVRTKGDATVERSTGKIRRLVVHDIEPIEQTDQPSRLEVPSAFWESTSFQELAMQQGVYPVDDVEKVTGGWPEDADFESFLRSVLSARSG
jgi:hypothetical protein